MTTPTPEDLTITPRDLKFGDASASSHWWHGGDPVATAFYNALSASFPLGERFFIDAVKRFRASADPHLQDQIDKFVIQESIHTREHLAFNRIAEDHGYDLSEINEFLKRRIQFARSRSSLQQLAATTALEHFTAILAHAALTDTRHLEGAPDGIKKLWRWHAIEEIEHKAVSFDTYLAATRAWSGLGRWALRSYVMVITTVLFLYEIAFGAGSFFRQDGIATWKTWGRFLRYLLGKPGLLRQVIPSYLKYYLPGFHPWRVDDRALIREFEPSLAL